MNISITEETLAPYCGLIYEIYKTKGNFFKEEEGFKEIFYVAISHSLPDIANYVKEVRINITELDIVKVLVFSIQHLQGSIIIERYIRSIFSYLEETYSVTFDRKELNQSIKVCENLIKEEQIIPVYTFIKGMQEGARAVRKEC